MILVLVCVLTLGSTLRMPSSSKKEGPKGNVQLDSCLSDGQWVQDTDPIRHYSSPCNQQAAPKAVDYKWVPACRPLHMVNKDTFCSAMEKHQLTRIIEIGDSLQS